VDTNNVEDRYKLE